MKCIWLIAGIVSDLNSHLHCEKHCPIIRFQAGSRAKSAPAFLSLFETINNIRPPFVKQKNVLNIYCHDNCITLFPNMEKNQSLSF